MDRNSILKAIPETLRTPLLTEYEKILRNFRESKWEPTELNAGKLCEIIYSILKNHIDPSTYLQPSKPRNMVRACQELENVDAKKYSRSIRIQIPRMLIAIYEIRNNRNVGHVGGEVDPSYMDASVVLGMSKWLLSELIRIFHDVDVNTAEETVSLITERSIQILWEINGHTRVLDHKLSKKNQTLLVLYKSPAIGMTEKNLFDSVEYSSRVLYKKNILAKLHAERLIEFNQKNTDTIFISPKGILFVENNLLESIK